jgi:hypothetical protein
MLGKGPTIGLHPQSRSYPRFPHGAWWHVIPALRRLRQKNLKLESRLGYITRFYAQNKTKQSKMKTKSNQITKRPPEKRS